MTAFHITLIIVVLFIVIFGIISYQDGFPDDIEEWMGGIALTLALELLVVMICALIGAIIYALCHVDWYGFFHDKLF